MLGHIKKVTKNPQHGFLRIAEKQRTKLSVLASNNNKFWRETAKTFSSRATADWPQLGPDRQ